MRRFPARMPDRGKTGGDSGRSRRPGRDGFTLPEILVVLLILIIGILPLAIVQTRARTEVRRADRLTQALVLAQGQLEEMKAAGFGNAAPDSGQTGQLHWWASVQDVSFGLQQINVRVTWYDGARDQNIQVSDLMSLR
jgi:prepilin-type N-terminal cleavage/methylation domain-containing protein